MYYYTRINKLPLRLIFVDGIELRGDGRTGDLDITLVGETIWRWSAEQADIWGTDFLFHYLKSYINTPKNALDDIVEDYHGLREILLACDRRRGKHALGAQLFTTNSSTVRKIILHRLGKLV